MRIVLLKSVVNSADLLKATVLQEITVPAYTRSDGTFVPEHRKHVHVNTDRSKEDVLAGRGSYTQREAHARLSRMSGWGDMSPEHQHAHILSMATNRQNVRSAAAALSGWRSAARSGRNPSANQWAAFYNLLGNDRREEELAKVRESVGNTDHLSAPSHRVRETPDESARDEKIRTASVSFHNAGMTQVDGNTWRFARQGEGNESPSVSVRVTGNRDGSGMKYFVTRGGSFNSTLGGNALPTTEIGTYTDLRGALASVVAQIERINSNHDERRAPSVPQAEVNGRRVLASEDGSPLKLYHGGADVQTDQLNPLTFFTTNPEFAQEYIDGNGVVGGRVHAAYLSIKNPARDDDIQSAGRAVGLTAADFGYANEEDVIGFEYLSPHLHNKTSLVVAELKRRGFDGAQMTDFDIGGGPLHGDSFVVFDSSQVVPAESSNQDSSSKPLRPKGVSPDNAWANWIENALNSGNASDLTGYVVQLEASRSEQLRSLLPYARAALAYVQGQSGAAADPAAAKPATVRVNDMTMDRQPDGSWLSRGGVHHGEGSAVWIAANVQAGVDMPESSIHAMTQGARARAVDELVRSGKSPEDMLNLLFPDSTDPASGRREGETKTVMGHTYVLRDGRWHRQDQDQPAAESASAAPQDIQGMRYTNTQEGHDKFWTAKVDGSRLVVHYGRNGTHGQVSVTNYPTPAAAARAYERKRSEKLSRGYEMHGPATIPGYMLPRENADQRIILTRPVTPVQTPAPAAAPAPAEVQAVIASDAPPPADALPTDEAVAIHAAMSTVDVPAGVSRWSDSATNQQARRRINQLQALAQAGDLDGVTNFATSRSRANYALVDDYRTALLEAAHEARQAVQPNESAQPAQIPKPPEITGANPNNSALLAAKRKVQALYAAARSANPVQAVLAIQTSRGNGYMNRADDYKAALLSALGHTHAGTPTTEADAASVAPPAVVNARASTRRRPVAANPSVPADQDPAIAANPDGKTAVQLGFVPRPNVPLNWTVKLNGVQHPDAGLIPWPDARMRDLARRYLAQGSSKQLLAKEHQNRVKSRLAPLHDAFQNVEARTAEIQRQRRAAEAEEARRRQAVEEQERRAALQVTRARSAEFLNSLQALPDLHKPTATVGANITSYGGNLVAAGLKLGVSDAAMKEIVGRLVCDYGGNVKFTSSVSLNGDDVSINYNGNDGTRITRNFKKGGDGKYWVYHAYFRAGSQGNGAAKALFRTSLGVYQSMGVTKVGVTANIDVGGYAWAKFGFKPDRGNWEAMRRGFKNRLSSIRMSPAAKERVEQILNDPNPNAIFALSDAMDGEKNIGKQFLLQENWGGKLDLTDAVSKRRCLGYIGRGRN